MSKRKVRLVTIGASILEKKRLFCSLDEALFYLSSMSCVSNYTFLSMIINAAALFVNSGDVVESLDDFIFGQFSLILNHVKIKSIG